LNDAQGLGWFSIGRLGLVQAALGAQVMLVTSLLNRVMVVEYALPAAVPAALVGFHYAIQLSRPHFGHGSDSGGRRTPWIIGGMGTLGLGALLATNATLMSSARPALALLMAILAYALIGAGVGAAGTSVLALLASRTAETRRPAAAALTWIMMIMGIVVTAATAGSLLDPFSPQRLAYVAGGVVIAAFFLTLVAVAGLERRHAALAPDEARTTDFRAAIAETWADPVARRFSFFVFVAMLAYSMQDMVLEPFAGLVFGFTPGQSTKLSSVQHMGVLIGMLLVGLGGSAFGGTPGPQRMRAWVTGGCLGSALALAFLAAGASAGGSFPLRPAVFALGFFNGIFAVAAIGAMMSLAGAAGQGREGIRMGLWGAAQAIAFGLGGFLGAVGLDIGRGYIGADGPAFLAVFTAEALLFLFAARLAMGLGRAITPLGMREAGA
jgi:BCD family chlorophyll transporter-like MFS transporter